MPRKAANVPAGETPAQKFVRVANLNVNGAIKAIQKIGGMKGKGYESTPAQRQKVKDALTEHLGKAISQLNSQTETNNDLFKL